MKIGDRVKFTQFGFLISGVIDQIFGIMVRIKHDDNPYRHSTMRADDLKLRSINPYTNDSRHLTDPWR